MRQLLAPLTRDADVRLYLRIKVNGGGDIDPADLVYPIIFSPDFDPGPYRYAEPKRPSAVAELRSELFRVDVPAVQMVPFLRMLFTTDFAYLASRGPLSQQGAESIARKVVDLLGPDVRWWSNVEYPAWAWECGDFSGNFGANPLTGHTYDCAMVGIGDAVAVAFLAYSDD
ncbi:hypothetical protein ACIBI3_32485 [Actinomadura luteofluorescens]|uniref:hypothetical protein n=1 Tax=Actinomadura luteofluorescens TaxID=46163 RepID=UPI00348B631B